MGRLRYRYENLLFGAAWLLGLGAIFFVCCYFTIWSHRDSTPVARGIDIYIEESKYISKALEDMELPEADRLAPSDTIGRRMLESLETMRASQIMLMRDHDNLVNDFRQEMNNNINKVNTWLAFAIGIISILGVFVPLVLQYKMQTHYDAKFIELADKQQLTMRTRLNELNRTVQSRLDELKVVKDELDALKEKWKHELELSEMGLHFNAFQIGIHDGSMHHNPNREVIFKHVWSKAVSSFDSLVKSWNKTISSSTPGSDIDKELEIFQMEGLIKLYAMVNILKTHDPKRRHRLLWNITDKIESILNELNRELHTTQSRESVSQEMEDLLKKLNEVEIIT